MDTQARAGVWVLLFLEVDTLLLLVEKGIMTPPECLQRLQRVREAAAQDQDTAPALSLIDGVAVLLQRIFDSGWPQKNPDEKPKAEKALQQFLQEWASGVKH